MRREVFEFDSDRNLYSSPDVYIETTAYFIKLGLLGVVLIEALPAAKILLLVAVVSALAWTASARA